MFGTGSSGRTRTAGSDHDLQYVSDRQRDEDSVEELGGIRPREVRVQQTDFPVFRRAEVPGKWAVADGDHRRWARCSFSRFRCTYDVYSLWSLTALLEFDSSICRACKSSRGSYPYCSAEGGGTHWLPSCIPVFSTHFHCLHFLHVIQYTVSGQWFHSDQTPNRQTQTEQRVNTPLLSGCCQAVKSCQVAVRWLSAKYQKKL